MANRELVWKKKLSRTDAQRQNGNQTGDIRLTQAGFRHQGKLIDHTRYFRNYVFGEGDWNKVTFRGKVDREVATFTFNVLIGEDKKGSFLMDVSHKPSGEASQRNYTTGLRWGPVFMGYLMNQADVSGMVLNMFKLDNGRFEIVISEEVELDSS